MLQQPKKVKFNKHHKNRTKSLKDFGDSFLVQNKISLISRQCGILKSFEISAVKKVISNVIKRKKYHKIILHVFPHFPKTKKPVETRMGKGKGSLNFWFTKLSKGTTICTILSLDEKKSKLALKKASRKVSLKTYLKKN